MQSLGRGLAAQQRSWPPDAGGVRPRLPRPVQRPRRGRGSLGRGCPEARQLSRSDRIKLAFFGYPKRFPVEDFAESARRIRDRYPSIAATAYSTKRWLPTALGVLAQSSRPTLSIELDRVRPLPPLRGTRLRQSAIS